MPNYGSDPSSLRNNTNNCFDSSMTPRSYSNQQKPEEGMALPHNNKSQDNYQQTTMINNNSCNNGGDFMIPEIINAVNQLPILSTCNTDNEISLTYSEKNNDNENNKMIHEPTISLSSVERPIKNLLINDKNPSVVDSTDFDNHTSTILANNNCMNSETSNDEFLSQSPLNLTRSQGSEEGSGNKSEIYDEGEYDDENEEKNEFGNVLNADDYMVNGHNLPTTEASFPWNITSDNNNKQNKQQSPDDKVPAPPPQLLLTSGQLTTGCLQAAQLLIPTARGIMTQTILAIPINDMVASTITAPIPNQQQLYSPSSNVRKKINNEQLNQICQPSLPSVPSLNRYFQQNQTITEDTTNVSDTLGNVNNDTTAADQYNNALQRLKWQSPPDLTSKKHNFLSPQQKPLPRTKNLGSGELMNTQRSKESTMIQTPSGINGDSRIYPNNNSIATPMSPPIHPRTSINKSGADAIQRQTNAWPTGITSTELQHNGAEENDEDDKQQSQHQTSHGITQPNSMSSINMNTLKLLGQPSSQLKCPTKPTKGDNNSTSAAVAAYNQQNAICTALATHMLCASQLAAAQRPMFDNLDNSNTKNPNQAYSNNNNNNNNNNSKTNNMMSVVNPAVLEKWMMDEQRYYYNNNSNNIKNVASGGGHTNQRYNAAAAAAAAAVAVELLNGGGVSTNSSGAGTDSLTSCKKRKRRTSFTPHALELLNGHFERNTHPSGSEITGLAHRLGYEREVIRIWFCNKRQALKNTVRTISGSSSAHHLSTKSHNSGY
ncbi:Homeobox domain,Homeobox domain-like,POU domain [Cinara cedri]|uniref:Homeobox domain,Homeobox domain-like,POU domain n=1 Tax=Cinara cedri TaxID=506608 RepID=A0A5E4MSR2_9HEMI|nr:Homeobox domain,Homeobox domain-like,POU domain [Cinara cedri]